MEAEGEPMRWDLVDLYEHVDGLLTRPGGTSAAYGPADAADFLDQGVLTEAQAAVLASATEEEAVNATGAYMLRISYRNRIQTIRPADAARARLELFEEARSGARAYMFEDEVDPVLSLKGTAAVMLLAPWFVTSEVCRLIEHAAPQMPNWELTEDDLPAGGGLIVFGDIIESENTESSTDVPYWVNAVSFYVVHRGEDRYIQFDDWEAAAKPDGAPGWNWTPSGRYSWFLGTTIDDFGRITVRAGNNEDAFRAQSAAMRRRIACLWALAKTPRLVERTELHGDRPSRRRAARVGITTPVALFDIRATEYTGQPGGERGVDWSHRWIVEGHWRQQAHGPGRSLRRPTWIAPHVKGPGDKPLVVKDRVGVVRGDPPPVEPEP